MSTKSAWGDREIKGVSISVRVRVRVKVTVRATVVGLELLWPYVGVDDMDRGARARVIGELEEVEARDLSRGVDLIAHAWLGLGLGLGVRG